ncbi:monocarboxylate transporter 10 [Asbolus verrucosus]|uniref:Monocarboxylate transporter 10 n=1 Tax=Asbolus verrucosus TaxID=1661398 RepID=A0A482VAV4_ASBVE|nr:monocarboxylate transporter 10 [Asbolus verrucosus]
MSPPNGVPPGSTETEYLQAPTSPQDEAKCEPEEVLAAPENDAEVVVPPDGGWGWVVVFASFMCNMIVDGIIFSFGTFLRPIADTFHVTEAHVALVGSLMSGFYLIAGPFASAVANRYGFRLVAIVGSVLGAAAFALSYFATGVQYLCVTFGVLGGIGFGFIYVPSVITVGFYFEKWRALATGIAVCGSGIGTFLFAPISSSLIHSLGWRTALLCQGAIVITCVIFGILYRPLKPTKVHDIKIDEEETELKMDPNKLPPVTRMKMEKALEAMKSSQSCHGSQNSINRVLGANNNSNVYHTISIPQQRVLDISCYEKRLSVPFITNDDKAKDIDAKEYLLQDESANPVIVPKTVRRRSAVDPEVNRPMYRDDIFFSASLTRLPQYTSRTSIAYNLSVTRLPTKNDIEEEKNRSIKLWPEAIKRTLTTMLDFSLFKSPSFLLLAVGGFFTMMGFYVPFMYLTDRAKMYNIDENSAVFLISAIGIANTVGRVLCGILSSFPGVNALFVTNAALTIGGIATIFSGFSMTPEFQFTYTAIFGLAISCFASLRSIIVVDLLGLENLTNAFGLLLLFQGVAAVFGAPLAGAFKVATGSYDASFYLSGSLLLASAIMCYPLNYINRWELRRKNKTDNKLSVVI